MPGLPSTSATLPTSALVSIWTKPRFSSCARLMICRTGLWVGERGSFFLNSRAERGIPIAGTIDETAHGFFQSMHTLSCNDSRVHQNLLSIRRKVEDYRDSSLRFGISEKAPLGISVKAATILRTNRQTLVPAQVGLGLPQFLRLDRISFLRGCCAIPGECCLGVCGNTLTTQIGAGHIDLGAKISADRGAMEQRNRLGQILVDTSTFEVHAAALCH